MAQIERILRGELQELEKIVQQVRKRLQTAPQGSLRTTRKGNRAEYYYKREADSGNSGGRYMRKQEIKLIKGLAQKNYDERLLASAEERRKAITSFLKRYRETDLANIYRKTNDARRPHIHPAVIPDELYIKMWESVKYEGVAFVDGMPEIITEKGERVRSKSEKIIADKLYLLGIPYRYEYPLNLKNHITLHPDFTILKMPERQEVYLEHFGMMDSMEYVDRAMARLETYEKNGIFVGVTLFLTHETGKHPLNTKMLDGFLKSAFSTEESGR